MTKIEYFFPRLNGWLSLDLEEYVTLIFNQDDLKLHTLKNFRHLPLKIKLETEEIQECFPTSHLISGNYVEILLQQELTITSMNNPKGSLVITESNNENQKYDFWVQAKIVKFDLENSLLFLEYNDQLVIIDDLTKVRSLSSKKSNKTDLVLYYIKKLSNSDYESFKKEYDILKADANKLMYQKADLIRSSLIFLGEKSCLQNLNRLKELEDRYGGQNGESNTNSEFGITSRSGHSEEESEKNSRKSRNSNNHEEDEILNAINNYKYKESFVFNSLFKKDAEKILKNIFKKNKYFVTANNSDEFKIILYGNNETEFNEEKDNFEKQYKDYKIKIDGTISNKSEISSLAQKAKVQYIYFTKNYLYLIGEEKNLTNFNKVFGFTMQYSKEIQKTNKEKENIKKELNNFKKKNKIK